MHTIITEAKIIYTRDTNYFNSTIITYDYNNSFIATNGLPKKLIKELIKTNFFTKLSQCFIYSNDICHIYLIDIKLKIFIILSFSTFICI